jgi:hypothetical protein
MRLKLEFKKHMHGYTTSTLGEMIPGYSNIKKVNQQIKEIRQKETDYINSMSGDVKISKIVDKH